MNTLDEMVPDWVEEAHIDGLRLTRDGRAFLEDGTEIFPYENGSLRYVDPRGGGHRIRKMPMLMAHAFKVRAKSVLRIDPAGGFGLDNLRAQRSASPSDNLENVKNRFNERYPTLIAMDRYVFESLVKYNSEMSDIMRARH